MLKIQNVSKVYRRNGSEVWALKDASVQVLPGEFVSIQGSSGSGKTTLLLAAGALLRPSTGTVLVDGENPYELNAEDRARLRASKIGFVFQQFHLVPYLSVLENVLTPALAVNDGDPTDRALDLIDVLGLTERIDHRPAELSSGECQRVALGRALLNQPKLILADEPTGNLDDCNARIVLESLAKFAEDGGSVLLVTHSGSIARRAHRVLRLEAGSFQPA